jgi:hypothetical protein
MISYIKIYGPPVYDAIQALETVAVDLPEVCIMDTFISKNLPEGSTEEHERTEQIGGTSYDRDQPFSDTESEIDLGPYALSYFSSLSNVEITRERCDTIISKSGQELGDYDFFFEWFKNPTNEELGMLIKKIDEALKPLNCKYTITTK